MGSALRGLSEVRNDPFAVARGAAATDSEQPIPGHWRICASLPTPPPTRCRTTDHHRPPPVGNSVAALFVDFRHHRFRPCRESTVGSVEMPKVTTDTSFAASTLPLKRRCDQSRGKYQEFVSDRFDWRTTGRWRVLPPQSGAAGGRLGTNIDRPRRWRRETAFECQLFQAIF
jgi:hypothetical protein